MAYIPDLTIDSSGYSGSDPWNDRVVKSVGWMEPPHPLPIGDVPAGFIDRLAAFCTWDKLVNLTCGYQDCEFCATKHGHWHPDRRRIGNGEIRVLGDGVAYAAPSMIAHYVAVHRYLPPAEFIDAVMNGPKADARVYVQYRLHWWEDEVNEVLFAAEVERCRIERRHIRVIRFPPPGSTFGPLIRWYRRFHYTTALMVVTALLPVATRDWRVLLVSVLTLALLAFLLKRCRAAMQCPACGKPMDLPWRQPKNWSYPHGVAWDAHSTMYCHDCGIGLRSLDDLWGDFKSQVVTNW
jgi:hypothetical protein